MITDHVKYLTTHRAAEQIRARLEQLQKEADEAVSAAESFSSQYEELSAVAAQHRKGAKTLASQYESQRQYLVLVKVTKNLMCVSETY